MTKIANKIMKRGVDLRKEQLKKLILLGEQKKKENHKLDAQNNSLKQSVINQKQRISENQQKSASLDGEYEAKQTRNEKQLAKLDNLFIGRKTKLNDEVKSLRLEKKELQKGANDLGDYIEKAELEKKKYIKDIWSASDEIFSLNIKLEILNKTIIDNKNMAKKAKSEKELVLNEVKDDKKTMVAIKTSISKLQTDQEKAQKELDKIITKTDYLVRFEDHLKMFEEHNKEWCKRLGVPYQPFQ